MVEGSADGVRSDFGYFRQRLARHGYALEWCGMVCYDTVWYCMVVHDAGV